MQQNGKEKILMISSVSIDSLKTAIRFFNCLVLHIASLAYLTHSIKYLM